MKPEIEKAAEELALDSDIQWVGNSDNAKALILKGMNHVLAKLEAAELEIAGLKKENERWRKNMGIDERIYNDVVGKLKSSTPQIVTDMLLGYLQEIVDRRGLGIKRSSQIIARMALAEYAKWREGVRGDGRVY